MYVCMYVTCMYVACVIPAPTYRAAHSSSVLPHKRMYVICPHMKMGVGKHNVRWGCGLFSFFYIFPCSFVPCLYGVAFPILLRLRLSVTSSPFSLFTFMSFPILSFHLVRGRRLLLLPSPSLSITLLPTWSVSLLLNETAINPRQKGPAFRRLHLAFLT